MTKDRMSLEELGRIEEIRKKGPWVRMPIKRYKNGETFQSFPSKADGSDCGKPAPCPDKD
jgi:hypothetical protein